MTPPRLPLFVYALTIGLALSPAVGIFAQPIATAAQAADTSSTAHRILQGARHQARKATPYIMNYEVIKYPGGDVAEGTGVCTDLVVRAFRNAGIDLQEKIQQDMKARPTAYPKIWDNKSADPNIDHRRCPNLVAWLKKNAEEVTTEMNPENAFSDWKPGDVVFYVKEGATHPWHVAIVSDKHDAEGMPLIIDSFPPATSETHRLDHFSPIHSHFRMK